MNIQMKHHKAGIQRIAAVFNGAVFVFALVLLFEPEGRLGRPLAEWREKRALTKRIAQSWSSIVDLASKYESDGTPVSVVEVVDYQCPFCRESHAALIELARTRPDMRVGFLQFPLTEAHPKAELGARYALCAGRQDRFRHAHDYLLTTTNWSLDRPAMFVARDIGVHSPAEFVACLKDHRTEQALQEHREAVNHLGVRATPTWITGTSMRSGVLSATLLASLVESTP